jgi:hypothetical protein
MQNCKAELGVCWHRVTHDLHAHVENETGDGGLCKNRFTVGVKLRAFVVTSMNTDVLTS